MVRLVELVVEHESAGLVLVIEYQPYGLMLSLSMFS
jgi:hypothetical protein